MEFTWTPARTGLAGVGAPASTRLQRADAALAERIRYLEAVRVVTEEITRELDLTTLLELITRRAVELVEAAVSGAVFLWDETEQTVSPRAWHGYGEWMREVRLKLGEGIAGAIAQSRTGLLVNDYQNSPYAHPVFVQHTRATAILGEPLLYHKRLVGVIILNNGTTGQGFTMQDQEILSVFGAQAASAIENARLYATLEARHTRLQTLARLNQVISSSLDTDEVLSEIARAAATLMAVPFVAFWVADATTQTLQRHAVSDARLAAGLPYTHMPFGEGVAGWVAAQRRSLLVPDVFVDARNIARDWWQTNGLRSMLAIPILFEETLLGVLSLCGRQPFHLEHDDQGLLNGFVAQAAIAIKNARLFAEARQQAVDLERANTELHREIHERQQAEEALRQARDELERRVEERTAAWRIANTQLQRSNQELQDFSYVASHDLQEPLRKVQAFGDRLQAKCGAALSEQGRDYLERMQNAARRMQTLINDLMTFSRVTTKAEPFVAVDLASVVREVMSDLEVRLEQTGGSVEVSDLPTIAADPTQMRQLFQNLIGNALKFRHEEAPIVRVCAQRLYSQAECLIENAPGAELCQITVSDNGIGFDEKYLDRIFNVFQRLHGRNAYEGTGVGLAVCRRIAQRHGGSITARSAPGQGATFVVTLPVIQSPGEHTTCPDMGSPA